MPDEPSRWRHVTARWSGLKIRLAEWSGIRWVRLTALGLSIPVLICCFALGYYYVSFARLLDARLHGERSTVLPRVFARPLELRRGQSLTAAQLVDRLNDLGYAQRTMFDQPGEFIVGSGDVTIIPRGPEFKGQSVRVVFQRPAPSGKANGFHYFTSSLHASRYSKTAWEDHGADTCSRRQTRPVSPGDFLPRAG